MPPVKITPGLHHTVYSCLGPNIARMGLTNFSLGMKNIFYLLAAGLLLSGCVATRKFRASQEALAQMRSDSAAQAARIAELQTATDRQHQQITELTNKITALSNQAGQLSSDVANKNSQLGQSRAQ